MEVLLTGFEPFGGAKVNPSEQLALRLDNTCIHQLHIQSHILPVDGQRAPQILLGWVKRIKPVAVVCLGEAPRRPVISLERVAVNLLDYRIPDNRGRQTVDKPIRKDGPAAYFSSLPVRAIHDRLQKNGIPCELSLSAGAYLCNQVLYTLLDHCANHALRIPAGFIHLPSLPEEAAVSDMASPSMSLDTTLSAMHIVIEIIAEEKNRKSKH